MDGKVKAMLGHSAASVLTERAVQPWVTLPLRLADQAQCVLWLSFVSVRFKSQVSVLGLCVQNEICGS